LIADQLNDPESWSRFVPCHSSESERYLFESTVRGAGESLLKARKELMSRGRSVYEFDWQMSETDILTYATELAERLAAELVIGDADTRAA
jgi:hypothetical protein